MAEQLFGIAQAGKLNINHSNPAFCQRHLEHRARMRKFIDLTLQRSNEPDHELPLIQRMSEEWKKIKVGKRKA